MYENPSAGKFDPPTTAPTQDPERHQRRWLTVVLLILTSYPISHRLLSYRGHGGYAALAPVAAFALTILHFVLQRRRAAELGRDNPYTPPMSVTR